MSASIQWQKSSFSGGGDGNACVEVASTGDGLRLRESDAPADVLSLNAEALSGLLAHIKGDDG